MAKFYACSDCGKIWCCESSASRFVGFDRCFEHGTGKPLNLKRVAVEVVA